MIQAFGALGMLFWLFLLACAVCWPLFMFLAYRRLRGVERALWAIRGQLEQANRLPEAATSQRATETPSQEQPRRPVSLSMFGR